MQPNEVLSDEDRIAELEEASMLFAMVVSGETPEESKIQTEARLAYLFQRMRDRMSQREVERKLRERDARVNPRGQRYHKAFKEGRLSEYHCSQSGERAMFITGEDDDAAHIEWLDKHPDAVLLSRTDQQESKPVTVTEDSEL